MRALYVQPAEAFGGAERQGVAHIAHLPDFGVDVLPVVGPGRPILTALAEAGVEKPLFFPHFPGATHARLSLAGNLRYGADWVRAIARSAHELTELASRYEPDVILANRTVGWLVAAPVAQALGVPWVARAGSRMVSRLGPLGILGMQLRWPSPAALLANCAAVGQDIGPWFDAPVHELPNAIDTDRFHPRRRATVDVPEGARVVGIAARPAPEKGLDFLLDVVAEVRRRVPDALFLWAGAFGWRPVFEERVRRAGLDGALRFLGHVDDVPGFYAACDAVVLTSRRRSIEGSPNALLEAMAMERPVVATAVGGVPELVRHGVEGFLADDGDVAAFADGLATLLGDRALARRLGAAGRRRVLARHSIPYVVSVLADRLRAVADRDALEPGATECA